ncbi:hypothetical protein [Saezia sanguinis]|nr:hypothetical protein [Saezia sanguinis]
MMVKIALSYSQPLVLYLGLSYDVLLPQWKTKYAQAAWADEWDYWEQMWDDTLGFLSHALAEHGCQVIQCDHISPLTMQPEENPATMHKDLHTRWRIVAQPPHFDAGIMPSALTAARLHGGILYYLYDDRYGRRLSLMNEG